MPPPAQEYLGLAKAEVAQGGEDLGVVKTRPSAGDALSFTQAMAVLAVLAAGEDIDTIVEGYAWMEREDVLACIEYARRLVGHERIEPLVIEPRTA